MNPRRFPLCRRALQRGVSILSAIFMLLLFGALAAYMVSFTGTAQITSAQDIQGARAYLAAEAGLEWGLYHVMQAGGCPAGAMPQLDEFTMSVTCEITPPGAADYFNEAGHEFKIYRLTSRASTAGASPGSPAFIEREVRATVELERN
jgi:MSHA biogenesis protein MshP